MPGWPPALPGMCNPDDHIPCVTGEPADDAAATDLRSHAQRQHDALNALVRGQLGDPKLGVHNGLPVTVVVSTTLQRTHRRRRACGDRGAGHCCPCPISSRMASHAHHYLDRVRRSPKSPTCISGAPEANRLTRSARGALRHGPRMHPTQAATCPAIGAQVHHLDDWARGSQPTSPT